MSQFDEEDDDFDLQFSLSQRRPICSSLAQKPSKIPKRLCPVNGESEGLVKSADFVSCSLDSIPSSFDCAGDGVFEGDVRCSSPVEEKDLLGNNQGYALKSIESRLLNSCGDRSFGAGSGSFSFEEDEDEDENEDGDGIDELLKFCSEMDGRDEILDGGTCRLCEGDGVIENENGGSIDCPLCGVDLSDLSEEQRYRHTNNCLDKLDALAHQVVVPRENSEETRVSKQPDRVPSVAKWLLDLGLAKYEDAFAREEIDWETLQCLTEEDLLKIGITALGPRKKIVQALSHLGKASGQVTEADITPRAIDERGRGPDGLERRGDAAALPIDIDASKVASNKLITDYFPGSSSERKKVCNRLREGTPVVKKPPGSARKDYKGKKIVAVKKRRDPPSWCCIPGTPFKVDAFRYLQGDCSHWFLTHFHMDHYQGLTKSFRHGKIYCSSITAKLVNVKIGIPLDKLHVLPLNQKIAIAGINVTCLDANHCPGAVIILFEPPNGKAVLHTGDFRYSEDTHAVSLLKNQFIHTLILDTTYCNPQYDFPKQETVIQFVIDAVQAESFNPKTLFLIGSYTIGKERLFLEVARVLRKKIYVNAAKLRVLNCLELPPEDMQWFTLNEKESQIHVVPMWMLGSFKRLKNVANHYQGRYSPIVAITPTGWTFDKTKKKSPGRKYRQGTIMRYEVPYSEHSSFTELKEFVKMVSPVTVIPSVNNDSPESASSMISLLVS